METYKPPLLCEEFWKIKNETDDIVKRLGWSAKFRTNYLLTHYGCIRRLNMTDEQLIHLLGTMRKLDSKSRTQNLLTSKAGRNRRKRK